MSRTVETRTVVRRAGLHSAVGAMLAAAYAVALARGLAAQTTGVASLPPARTAPADSSSPEEKRRFAHGRHERLVSCRACHGTGARHRTILVRSPADCAACHHDPARGMECRRCHASDRLPAPRRLAVTLPLSVSDAPRSRELPFDHARHGRLECRSCHRAPVTLAPSTDCAACHDQHHRAEASCTSCHERVATTAHGPRVHESCTGAGCHAGRVAPTPALSRNLCLVCHREQGTHEPGRDCAQCHAIPNGSAKADRAVATQESEVRP